MSTADLHSVPIQATPPGTPIAATEINSTGKRLLFGRKKKSAVNLGGSSPTNTLISQSGSLQGNGSVESLGGTTDDGTSAVKKGVKNVFKRKTKVENSSVGSSIGNIDENAGVIGGDSNLYEDEAGSLGASDESDSQIPPNRRQKEATEYLSSAPTTPSTASNKTSGKPRIFSRRSTSPMAALAHTNATFDAAGKSQSEENTKSPTTPEARPSTSAGESHSSQDRGRGVGRMPVSTSDASNISPISAAGPGAAVPGAVAAANRRMSVGVRLTTKLSESSDAAPTTTITPPTPTDSASHFPPKSPVGAIVNATNGRRSRTDSLSNAPSKLSQSMTNEGATSSSDSPNPTGGGFFQSMFSAAHNAATSLTNNIPLNLANNPNSRARSTTVDSADTTKSSTEPLGDVSSPSDEQQREREPAVKTLGMGELNLATLGIVPDPVATTQTNGTNVVSARGNGSRDDIGLREHKKRYSAPQTPAYGGFDTAGESPSRGTTPYAEDVPFRGNSNTSAGDLTPDRNSLIEQVDEDGGMDGDPKRSGSVRSGGGTAATAKRHRGSSAASQGTLLLPTPRTTGFAVANTKRNRDFHNLFKSVPEEDYLIEDYGCALQREILLQGRLYVSERHICFYSNILGWVTTLVISFDEVMSVEKKSTALLFPNAIVIQTLHARHVFASFISRDSTYDLIVGLWNVGGSQVVNGNGEAHLDGAPSGGDSGEEDGDEYMDESEDDGESFTDAGDGPLEDNDNTSVPVALKNPSRKPSQLPISNGAATGGSTDGGNNAAGDFPGPKTHSPTVCGDDDKHYDKNLCDEILPVPLGQIYSLIFGAASHPFLTQLLTEEEKVLELQIPNNGEWIDQDGKKTRTFSYVKPLPGTIGPSKTRCIITETIDHYDLEDHISVTVSTQTPDVPSGGVFSVKTRYCLMWAEGCSTRLISNCAVEWTGKSWIKAPIEKGANDGQVGYNKVLLTCLRREIAPKRAGGRSGKGKGKRRNAGTGGAGRTAREAGGATSVTPTPSPDSWGFLEPLKPIFGPIVDIFGPLLPANFMVIVITVLITLFLSGMIRPATNQGEIMRGNIPRYLGAQRYWEDGWIGAEEGLWEWLEDRAGIDAIPSLQQKEGRRKSFEKKVVKAAGSVMKNRQVQEAISVLKERLASLERIVDEKKKFGEREEEKEKVEKGNTEPVLEL